MKQKIDHLENAQVLKTEEMVRLTEENKVLEERLVANSFLNAKTSVSILYPGVYLHNPKTHKDVCAKVIFIYF